MFGNCAPPKKPFQLNPAVPSCIEWRYTCGTAQGWERERHFAHAQRQPVLSLPAFHPSQGGKKRHLSVRVQGSHADALTLKAHVRWVGASWVFGMAPELASMVGREAIIAPDVHTA